MDKIEREIYIDKISAMYNISKEAIYAEINKNLYKSGRKDALNRALPKKNKTNVVSEAVIKREKSNCK